MSEAKTTRTGVKEVGRADIDKPALFTTFVGASAPAPTLLHFNITVSPIDS